MFYYCDFESSESTTRFTFRIETVKQKGWVQMRMVSIEDLSDTDKKFDEYDPLIHTPEKSHYMSFTYTSRKTKCPHTKQTVYRTRFCKGEPYFYLTQSETIVRL
jgi:hypothetical protein